MIPLAMAAVRAVIWLYPARFRDRFGAELLDAIRGELVTAAAAGPRPLAGASLRVLVDAARGLIPEHRAALPAVRFTLHEDAADAVRSLRQAPTFTIVALAVLALGIGASTAIFSVVDAVVLRGLPFDHHDRIVTVLEHNPARPASQPGSTMPQIYLEWRDRQQSFAQLAAINRQVYRVRTATGELDNARGLRVTRNFLPMLRVQPALGRGFTADDEIDGRHRVAILSHAFWQRRFGGAADVVGRTLEVNDETWEVAGVMPRGFSFPVGSAQATEIFAPLAFRAADRIRAGGRS
jgi:putative ABC transport system permease protein